MREKKKITSIDFSNVLKTSFPDELADKVSKAELYYEELDLIERDNYIREVVEVLVKKDINSETKPAGQHRINEWEKGWSENLDSIKRSKEHKNLIPKYYGKRKLARWRQNIIRPLSEDFDYKMLSIIVDWVGYEFFSKSDYIFEFGCGPAEHLLRARSYNSTAKLIGLDWTKASQEIINEIKNAKIETNIDGVNFNFFTPDDSIEVPENSAFLTVAALEQIGSNFEPFLEFVLEKKPKICVHLEPIAELLDNNNLLDKLSTLYFEKRNYLQGFLPRLLELEKIGKIKIVRMQRTYSGSYFIEGHSLIAWYPINN